MIQKLIRRFLSKKSATADLPKLIPFRKHGISRERISPCALKVCEDLRAQRFSAFVVGGAVRDLLMDVTPKDYDVATDATPEQVRTIFKRSRIIGRRFRIVHVMCGRETIEVTTFRGQAAVAESAPDSEGDSESETDTDDEEQFANASGRLLRDNVFGSQLEDAARRDFTVNALYYDPLKQEVWDYLDGMADLRRGVLRMIGDPETRYREDPVRLLRAVRLAAKMQFKLDAATQAPIRSLAPLLLDVPRSRLFDEMLKLFHSGHALASARRLREEGLHHGVLPLLDAILEQPMGERFINLALQATDQRVQEGKPVSPAFLFATLVWHQVLKLWADYQAEEVRPLPAFHDAMEDVIQSQVENLAIPRRYTAAMREIWSMQPRFLQRAGQRPFRLLEHPKFRAGYDFLLLRCESGELDSEIGLWWERFQTADSASREQMLIKDEAPLRKRRRKRSKKPAAAAVPADD